MLLGYFCMRLKLPLRILPLRGATTDWGFIICIGNEFILQEVVIFATVSAIVCAAMDSVKTDLFTAEHIISPRWLAPSFLIICCHAALKAERCFAFEVFRISIDKEGEKGSRKVWFLSTNTFTSRLPLILVILFDRIPPGLYRHRFVDEDLLSCFFMSVAKLEAVGPHIPFPWLQHNAPVLVYGHTERSTMHFTVIRCQSWLEQRDMSTGWGTILGLGSCSPAPWASFSSSVSWLLCLFVPRLRVWASRIYEIRGQVKGHSSQVKWEAKICETKEMTGQCQVKGQKSSERFSVDESEQPARQPDHTPKWTHTSIHDIKMQLKFHSLG